MRTVQCLVFLCVWTLVSVDGIRVPTDWNDLPVESWGYESDSSLRFRRLNSAQNLRQNPLERMAVDGELENSVPNTLLHNYFRPNPQTNIFQPSQPNQMIPLNQNIPFFTPSRMSLPPVNSAPNNLPPLLNPRYSEQSPTSIYQRRSTEMDPLELPKETMQYQQSSVLPLNRNDQSGAYEIYQKLPFTQKGNEAYEKYETLPRTILNMKSTVVETPTNDKYKQLKMTQMRQEMLNQLAKNSKVHKEYPQAPTASVFNPYTYGKSLQTTLDQSLNHRVPQNHKFIVSASEEDATLNPLGFHYKLDKRSEEFSTKREPVFFVTEGYRNVLVQGPNKKKKYIGNPLQMKEESRRILSKQKFKDDDDATKVEEDEKPPRKRKVTKIYRIYGNEENANNIDGTNRNLLNYGRQNPRSYFESPQVNIGDDRRSGLRNHLIKNYRDDTLHEPREDKDNEREDADNEKISDDEINEDNYNNDENNSETAKKQGNYKTDIEKTKTDGTSSKPEKSESSSSDSTEEEEDDEESDDLEDEEAENENEEKNTNTPHSEHADPKPVPTKPIYPGEGQWAKPELKHRPYNPQHKFLKPVEDEQKPDGYDVFENLEQYFESQKKKFGSSLGANVDQQVTTVPSTQISSYINAVNSPHQVNPIVIYDPFTEPSHQKTQTVFKEPTNVYTPDKSSSTIKVATDNTNNDKEEDKADNNDEENEELEEEDEGEESDDEEEEADEFVPLKLYSQVRKSENVEHEPYNPLEHGRLKEIIKDSKVQTVYTEEGYEDSAYDHAGHEKKAEQDQGYAEFEREKHEEGKPKPLKENDRDSDSGHSKAIVVSENPIQPLEDSIASDSTYHSKQPKKYDDREDPKLTNRIKKLPKSGNNNNFISTQEVKTTQVKDKNNGDVQLEIQSEVKVVVQPNNSTKSHRYVKIFPKILKDIPMRQPEEKENFKLKQYGDADNMSSSTTERIKQSTPNASVVNIVAKLDSDPSDIISNNMYKTIYNRPVLDQSTTESSTVSDIESMTKNIGLARLVRDFWDDTKKESVQIIASTEKPKVVVKVLDDNGILKKITDQFSKIGGDTSRSKRSSGSGFEDVNIDTDFIDNIKHRFAAPKPDIDVEKYPYYTLTDINENSPLRYAENMKNIPFKQEGELSFYKMADRLECPDIPQNIDPIPEHVKDKTRRKRESEESDDEYDEEGEEEEEDSEEDENQPPTPKTPRIELGDKIDCLKLRYFGDDPLDSPFFKEETVGPVKSIFKELERNVEKHSQIPDNSFRSTEIIANEIFNQKAKIDERKFESEVKDKIFNALNQSADKFDENKNVNRKSNTPKTSIENDKAESIKTHSKILNPPQQEIISEIKPTAASLVTLITTPRYTIQLKPKNIYDQIKLLDHLPEEDSDEVTTKSLEQTTIEAELEEEQESITESYVNENVRLEKRSDEINKSNSRQPKVLLEDGDKNKNDIKGNDTIPVEPEALRRRRFRPRRPVYQIFDVNSFLTTTPFSLISPAASTVLPKHKVLSEVFYKDEIKPNEQLTVFADVLNNIKNSSNTQSLPIQSSSDFAEPPTVTVSSLVQETNVVPQVQRQRPYVRVKKYQNDSANQQNYFEDDQLKPNPGTPTSENVPESNNIQNQHRTTKFANKRQPNAPKPGYVYNSISRKPVTTTTTNPNHNIDFRATVTPVTKTGTRKLLKRRRKPTATTSTTLKTTTNINVPNEITPNNHQPYVIDFIEDDEGVVGLVPPQSFQYRTIMVDNTLDRDIDEVPEENYDYHTIQPNQPTEATPYQYPAPVTEQLEEAPPKRFMNKYYFLGLKPPPPQRARPYSEFTNSNAHVNDNLLRRRVAHVGLSRAKRSASRPAYADLSRNRGRQNEGLEITSAPADDVDDYVPHRPKNYHYDEKTGKIVYHSKPAEEKVEEEEMDYEEVEIPDTPGIYLERVEDATHPTPEKVTTKQLLATATPPPEGQGLLDFVAKLKNNPTYKYIPDPSTPKPGSETSTIEGFTTVDPKTTDPPAFLSILSKVKNDKTYKYIEDPKESKAKSKTTTPEPESEEEYVDDDEEIEEDNVPKHVQNSPGGQSQDLGNVQIFDIGDYLPKIKTINPSPKTTIDYSKYKTIERPHTRHSTTDEEKEEEEKEELVSRPPFNPRERPVTEEAIVRRPVYMEEKESVDRPVVSEEKIGHDKEVDAVSKEAVTSTTQRIVQFRRGTRPTTQRTTAETFEPTSPTTRRSSNRRKPAPAGFRTTRRPTTTSDVTEAEKVQRIYPENYATERTYPDTHDKAKRVYRRRPTRIRHTTERLEEDDEEVEKVVRRSLDSEIGDFRNKFEKKFLEGPNVDETYASIKDDIVNDEVSDDDESYDGEVSESKTKETVKPKLKDVEIINKDYDKTQQHGGNYKRRDEEDGEQEEVDIDEGLDNKNDEIEQKHILINNDNSKEARKLQSTNTNKNAEIFNNNFDAAKKHGGNYRREHNEEEIEGAEDNYSREINEQTEDDQSNVELKQKYVEEDAKRIVNAKTVRNDGGKYLKVGEQEADSEEDTDINKKDRNKKIDVDVFDQNFDNSKQHGGNYKSEKDAEIDELLESKKTPGEITNTRRNVPKQVKQPKKRTNAAKSRSEEAKESSAIEGDQKITPEIENKPKPNKRRIILRPRSTTESPKVVPRLSDVVPKPDHFYSDPQLPEQVNNLGSEKTTVKLASEELAEVAEEGDWADATEDPNRRNMHLRRRHFKKIQDSKIERRIDDEDKLVVTKKPLFVKDPSKRLYFYAPV